MKIHQILNQIWNLDHILAFSWQHWFHKEVAQCLQFTDLAGLVCCCWNKSQWKGQDFQTSWFFLTVLLTKLILNFCFFQFAGMFFYFWSQNSKLFQHSLLMMKIRTIKNLISSNRSSSICHFGKKRQQNKWLKKLQEPMSWQASSVSKMLTKCANYQKLCYRPKKRGCFDISGSVV